ncbi:hypothetical protein KC338_g57 [Hortaea werneckii]|nr:hypothetical protein KC338_g57 [Hortaea werneckii]
MLDIQGRPTSSAVCSGNDKVMGSMSPALSRPSFGDQGDQLIVSNSRTTHGSSAHSKKQRSTSVSTPIAAPLPR